MNKRVLIFICFVIFFVQGTKSQTVSIEGVWHSDTVQYADPFSLGFWIVNTGNTAIVESFVTANISIAPINSAPQSWQILTFNQSIPQGIFSPGDSLFISDLNNPLIGGSQLYQQAGNNLVIIWPSFVSPVSVDSSITPLYVVPASTSINEMIITKYAPSLYLYDLSGRKYVNLNQISRGSIYIRDGKKYLKR